jgi:hypothetical protein
MNQDEKSKFSLFDWFGVSLFHKGRWARHLILVGNREKRLKQEEEGATIPLTESFKDFIEKKVIRC